ncbi:hypothetical protein VTH82DRAFT_952 [Thermothelomyces myriococcoides]
MKASVIVAALLPLASAWKLKVSTTDGRSVTSHGTTNSGCVNYDVGALKVNKVDFDDSAFADTFELYTNRNCDKLNYRNGDGTHKLKARTVRSYKVY